jgi:ankyrin repeat protein
MAQPNQLPPDARDWLPIHHAAYINDTTLIRQLIQQGVDRNSPDHDGQTALHIAGKYNAIGAIVHLVTIEQVDVNVRNASRETALHRAAHSGHPWACKTLVENAANINASDVGLSTVLHHACDAGHLAIVQYLVGCGASTTAIDEDGHTPRNLAQQREYQAIVHFLP